MGRSVNLVISVSELGPFSHEEKILVCKSRSLILKRIKVLRFFFLIFLIFYFILFFEKFLIDLIVWE